MKSSFFSVKPVTDVRPWCVTGGSQGDLYVFVRVKEHADLRREGLTVHSDVSVSYVDAILGKSHAHVKPFCVSFVHTDVHTDIRTDVHNMHGSEASRLHVLLTAGLCKD